MLRFATEDSCHQKAAGEVLRPSRALTGLEPTPGRTVCAPAGDGLLRFLQTPFSAKDESLMTRWIQLTDLFRRHRMRQRAGGRVRALGFESLEARSLLSSVSFAEAGPYAVAEGDTVLLDDSHKISESTVTSFRFELIGPTISNATPGTIASIPVTVQIDSQLADPSEGAQAWSMSIKNLSPTEAALADPEVLVEADFSVAETTAGPDNVGIVSAVALETGEPYEGIVLPDGVTEVLSFAMVGPAPSLGETETWSVNFVDGLQGSGQPVPNIVASLGQSVTPTLSGLSITVIGADTVRPTLVVPADIVVENDLGEPGAIVDFAVEAADDSGEVTVDVSHPSGSFFPLGTTTVTAMATDPSGNQASDVFDVTVIDTTPPVLTAPGDVLLNIWEDTSPAHTGTATASDNTGIAPFVTFSDSDLVGPTSTVITRTWTATDASGNFATAQQLITVITAPGQLVPSLGDEVAALQLPHGMEESLKAKLDATLTSLEAGDLEEASNILGAFIHQVEAQRGKKLTDSEADELIEAATLILGLLTAN
jgi:hypothetical protein